MSLISSSLSGENCWQNQGVEISFDFSFDEKDFMAPKLSSSTFLSRTTTNCKYKYLIIIFDCVNYSRRARYQCKKKK